MMIVSSSPSSSSPVSFKKNLNRRRHQRQQQQGLYLYRTATLSSAELNPEQRKLPKPKPTLDINIDMETTNAKAMEISTSTSTDAPTAIETQASKHPVKPHNPRPKILVLGSTGRIGRHVIRNLMSCEQGVQVVAFVRDYERACEILYDDMIREHTMNAKDSENKPTLQVVVMDLVPKNVVAGYKHSEEDDDDDDDEEYAVSAARFYNDDVTNYDFRSKNKNGNENSNNDGIEYDYIDPYQPLYDAMVNATAVISTIGTVRETLPFVDYILKPWRIFLRPDKWCKDPSHPYYVNYVVNRKVLDCAEKEQRKRDEEWRVWEEANQNENDEEEEEEIDEDTMEYEMDNNDDKKKKNQKQGDRIRIIRISDLCVANPAWDVVTIFTNIMRSLVFRSQERCEKLLMKSDVVDTIVLRPGDLVDDIRNETCTSLQVDLDGFLPSPCYVGREDVAEVATLASLSTLDPQPKKNQRRESDGNLGQTQTQSLNNDQNIHTTRRRNPSKDGSTTTTTKITERPKAKHWNVAVGWAEKVTPSKKVPGQNSNKHDTPRKAFQFMVREENKRAKFERRSLALYNSNPFFKIIMGPIRRRIKQFQLSQTKPYGIFVLLPMIFMVYPMLCSIVYSTGRRIPVVEKTAITAISYLRPMWLMLIQQLRLAAIHAIKNDANNLKKLIY